MSTHPIIAGHLEAFEELEPLGPGPLQPDDPLPAGFVATYNPKPLSTRSYDWEVIHAPTYDGAEDSPTRHQIGFGATREAAYEDLQEQLDDEYAPLVDDIERQDLAFHRGNDWMESDRLEDVYGVRGLFK